MVRVRLAKLIEAEAIKGLDQQIYAKRNVGFLKKKKIREKIENQELIVAEIEKKLAGFIIFDKSELTWQIRRIGVLEAFRGQGIATKTVDLLYRLAREHKIEEISLNVRVDNRAAIGLYKKGGYKIRKRLKNYYHNKIDSYQMVKKI